MTAKTLHDATVIGECDYRDCGEKKCLSTTIVRPGRHPRLCPEHGRKLAAKLLLVPHRAAERFVVEWTKEHCKRRR